MAKRSSGKVREAKKGVSKKKKSTKDDKRQSKAVSARIAIRAEQRRQKRLAEAKARKMLAKKIEQKNKKTAVDKKKKKALAEEKKKLQNQREALRRVTIGDFKRKRFFVTAAELGAQVSEPFLRSIETLCEKLRAEAIILPMRPHLPQLSQEVRLLDPLIIEKFERKIHTEFRFNKSLKAVEIELSSQQTNPLTGLSRLARVPHTSSSTGKTSLLIAHSKQHLHTLPTGNSSVPKIIHSTGTCTLPAYRDNRIGRIAEHDHVIGGLVVEINGDYFHIRQVQADQDGSFVDLGVRYKPNGETEAAPAEALVLGDYHAGFEDPVAETFAFDVASLIKPKRIFFHDLFDSASVSHHREHSIGDKLAVPEHLKRLEDELSYTRNILKKWHDFKETGTELFVVASNHPEHLSRYLDEGRFIKDSWNYRKALELAHYYHNVGVDPVKRGVDPDGSLATWLSRDDDMRVEGVMVSSHGDKGPNGSRGAARNTEQSFGNAMVGHSHVPTIVHSTYVVGCLCKLKMGYNKGPSSWLHCVGAIYAGGGKQLIISVDGHYKL